MSNESGRDTAARRRSSLTTAKAFFLTAAFLSFLLSVWLWFSGNREQGLFVGIWVPSICAAGALILAGRKDD